MRKRTAGCLIAAIVAVFAGGAAAIVGVGFLLFVFPTNSIENLLPGRQAEMTRVALKWGRLAQIPNEARQFTIKTEGSSFTRTFVGSFEADRAVVERWLKESPGIREGRMKRNAEGSRVIDLKMGGGAAFGTVEVSADGTRVWFSVSWS